MKKYFALFSSIIIFLTACSKQTATQTPTPSTPQTEKPEPTLILKSLDPTAKPIPAPKIQTPKANTQVKSPLNVTGTIPSSWMFEGSFPIKLVDNQNEIIAQTTGKEKTPGSWQSEKDVPFTATLTFKTTATNGFLILENDNPSGLPENAQSYLVPVKF